MPSILLAPFCGIGLIAGIGIVSMSAYHGNQTAHFFERCEKEGLNPYYMFLHSNPSEFSRNNSIRDQLYFSNDVRFQVMGYRLGLR